MDLRGERVLRQIAERVMESAAAADQLEVVVRGGSQSLTRFANSYIHQNVQEADLAVTVRAVLGKRIGVAATDLVTEEGLQAVAERAVTLAQLQVENKDFVSLPGPTRITPAAAYVERTASFSADERAEVVRKACETARGIGLTAAGAFSTSHSEVAVLNSLGVWAYHRATLADFSTVIMGETSSGFAEHMSLDAGEVDGAALAAEAIERCQRAANPQPLEPGIYDVILLPCAVADFVDYFAYLSFGAQAFIEQRAFMSGRLGERVMGENISIWDDGLDPSGTPTPFDAEGVAKQRVELITDGVAKGVVWDSYYANKEGRESTGHALGAGNTEGPMPGNMFLAPGSATIDDMVASTRRGVLVTRFWYTRPVHPLTVVMTGMTRDGTFLVEDGTIKRPVRNLRFTQSYLEAMERVEAVGRETKLLPLFTGSCRVPALKVAGWNFTGATEF
jgi:predicted Zn-dependent protease